MSVRILPLRPRFPAASPASARLVRLISRFATNQMINVIDTKNLKSSATPEGTARRILNPATDQIRTEVTRYEVEAGNVHRVAPGDRTRVVYILEGGGAEVSFTSARKTSTFKAPCHSGVYLEPGEEAAFRSSGGPLVLLHVSVPKHTAKAIDAGSATPTGYFFDESKLQALVDERRIRTRTFWVNKETGLSGSWDLQLGRMVYGPQGYSPRHMHNHSKTSSVVPEHFYFIESGTGEVKHDNGSIPIGPGSMVFIPAGEWHSLVASDSGFDYIEFQAPFDFATTMDHDPLGKNWYIQGTDDGTGNPKLWVQS
jgi:mannose-6-phosphate isomerase-like protein (cupin superfamily)